MGYSLANYNGLDDNTENVAGTTNTLYLALLSDFDTLSTAKDLATATTPAEAINIQAEHEFKAGKAFMAMAIVQDTGKYSFKGSDKYQATGGEVNFEGMVAGENATIAGLKRKINNANMIVMIKTSNGVIKQIGSFDFPAKVSFEYDSDQTPDGRAGATVKVKAFARAEQFYPFVPEVLP